MSIHSENYYQPTNTIEAMQQKGFDPNLYNEEYEKRIAELPISKKKLKENSDNSNYEPELAKKIEDKNLAKEHQKLLQPRKKINKIIASEKFYTIPTNTESRTNSNDYIFLQNTNPRIAIFVEGFNDDGVDDDDVDNIYNDLCETNLCNDPGQLYIKLSTESDWNIGNRGKKFNKLIKDYDKYKGDKPFVWRMRNLFGSPFGGGGKKKTKRKKRKHVKSKKARKTRKHVKSRKQRKSRRKN